MTFQMRFQQINNNPQRSARQTALAYDAIIPAVVERGGRGCLAVLDHTLDREVDKLRVYCTQ